MFTLVFGFLNVAAPLPGWTARESRGLFADLGDFSQGVLVLRLGKAAGYTAAVDNGLKAWVTSYLPWVLNNVLAVQEREALK